MSDPIVDVAQPLDSRMDDLTSVLDDLVAGSGLSFADAGEHELKGIPDRWHLYRVVSEHR